MCRKLLIDGTACVCYTEFIYLSSRPAGHLFPFMKAKDKEVTVHSVHSNVAKIHSRLPAAMEFGLYVSGFWHIHAKTPRGIVVCEQ